MNKQVYSPGEVDSTYKTTLLHHPNVKEIRTRLKITQKQFCKIYHLSPSTVYKWERGITHPTGPAYTLLILIDKIPNEIAKALKNPRVLHLHQ